MFFMSYKYQLLHNIFHDRDQGGTSHYLEQSNGSVGIVVV